MPVEDIHIVKDIRYSIPLPIISLYLHFHQEKARIEVNQEAFVLLISPKLRVHLSSFFLEETIRIHLFVPDIESRKRIWHTLSCRWYLRGWKLLLGVCL